MLTNQAGLIYANGRNSTILFFARLGIFLGFCSACFLVLWTIFDISR